MKNLNEIIVLVQKININRTMSRKDVHEMLQFQFAVC